MQKYLRFFLLVFPLAFLLTTGASQNTVRVYGWHDINGNGLRTEAPLDAGVQLWTANAGGMPVTNTMIVPTFSGVYMEFTMVPDGDYVVLFPDNTVFPDYHFTLFNADGGDNETTDNNLDSDASPARVLGNYRYSYRFTLAANETYSDIGVGYFLAATIGDYVWEDFNGDGIQNGSDTDLPVAVDITVFDVIAGGPADDIFGNPIGVINVPGGTGTYSIPDLAPGTYRLTFSLPANWVRTVTGEGTAATDSDPDEVTGETPDIILLSDETDNNIDAGYYNPIDIGNRVWEDIDGNGEQDGGEPGINGVSVDLNGTAGDGSPVNLSDVTAGGGLYQFDDVPPGDYTITFTLPSADWFFTYLDQVAEDIDSDADRNTGETTSIMVVSSDPDNTDIDAGMFEGATVSDFVWEDLNGDGIQDGGEPGVVVDVNIYDVATGAIALDSGEPRAPIPAVTSTGAGAYIFEDLWPGEYYLVFDMPAGAQWRRTLQDQGADDTADSDQDETTGETATFILESGDENEDMDAGYFQIARISDYVWEDEDGNGLQDGGEPALSGIPISLVDDMGNPVDDADGNPVANTTSDGAGLYEFITLRPGDYRVIFGTIPDFYHTQANAAGGPTHPTDVDNDSDADEMSGETFIIELESDDDEEDIDAGYYEAGSIEGVVFEDCNGNGIRDGGEMLLPGWTVQLTTSTGGPVTDVFGNIVGTIPTDGSGAYIFENIPPGEYRIVWTLMGGYDWTIPDYSGGNTDPTDVDDDSDSDGGQSHIIILTSGREVMFVDAGVFMPIDLTGFAFFDNDNNSIFDMGETGAGNVEIELWSVAGGGPCPGGQGTLLSTMLTNGQGEYRFNALPPGSYIIRVAFANFGGGGTLNGFTATTPTEICVDLDCNFDPDVVDYDFGFFYDCDGNPTWTQWPNCEIASGNEVICNLIILDLFCGSMFTENSPGPVPSPLCPGGGAPHNQSWFAFVAGQGDYQIVLRPSNCLPGGGGQLGIQAGIYTDCTFSEAVFCQPECSTDLISLPSTSLTPGETYYFFLDGCAGSICDYEIDVTGSFSPYVLPFPTGISYDADGCMPICPGKEIRFEVEGLDLEIDYTWSVVDENGNEPDLNFPPNWPETMENNITLSFEEPGVYTVCMEEATNQCEFRGPACVDITISLIPDEIFDADPSTPELDPYFICGNDFPYNGTSPDMNNNTPTDQNGDGLGWQGGAITYDEANQVLIHEITSPNCNCTYNQIIRVDSLPVNPPQNITFMLCKDETPFEFDGITSFITFGFEDPILYKLSQTTQVNGCDSFVLYNAYVFEIIDGMINEIECDPIEGGVLVRFGDDNTEYVDWNLGVTWTYTWYDPDNNIIAQSAFYDPDYRIFRESGLHRLVITMTYNGPLGNKTCEFEYELDFDITKYFPDYPELQIVSTLCPGTGLYTHRVLNSDPDLTYTWTWPSGAVYVSGQLSDTLVLNWSNSSGGDVTVFATNGCGNGPVSVNQIYIPSDIPANFTITPQICVDKEGTITVTSSNSGLSNYIWDFGGGTPVAGSGVGRGPHQVVWSSPGIKTVTLIVELDGCQSDPFSANIEVVEPISAPFINCFATQNEVIFDWTPPAGVTGYSFAVTPAIYSGVQAGNMYTVSGVPVNTDVSLEVTFIMSGPCGNLVSSTQCRTQNCIAPTVTLTSPVDSLCLPEESGLINLMATTSATGGTRFFSGPGISDPTSPVFDPVAAGPGEHIILYRHTDQDGCVSNPAARVTIYIFNTPSSLFEAVPDNVCVTDVVNVRYLGDDGMGLGTLNYDFGGGTASGAGVGPFPVQYSTPGTKTISLFVDRDGCTSVPLTRNVTVDEELDDLVVTCIAQGLDFVEFGWNSDANANGYSIIIDGGVPFTQTGNTYRINGLMENQVVNIVVTAISPNACPDKTSAPVDCTAKSCPPIVVTMDPVQDICLLPATAIINLTAQVDNASVNQALFTWSGPGIIAGTNMFDPLLAGPGSHNITVTFSEAGCSETGIGTIKVNRRPVASFTGDTRICVTDNFVATVNGSSGPAITLDWTPDPVNSAGNTHRFSFATDGTFDVTLVVDSLGCPSLPYIESIIVEPELEVASNDSITCSEFLDNIQFNWGMIDCADSYRVFVNNVLVNTINVTNYNVTGLMEGEIIDLRVEFISDCECGDIAISKECVARNCPPVQLSLTVPQAEYCLEDVTGPIPVTLNITGGNGTGVATWTGSPFVNNQGVLDALAAGVGTHIIEYTYIQDDCTFEDFTSITINPTPSMVVGPVVQPICYNETTGSVDVSGNGGTGNLEILLDNQSVDPGTLDVGSGNHSLQVIDEKGCNTVVENFTITIPREPIIEITGPPVVNVDSLVTYSIPDDFAGFKVDSVIWTINGTRYNCNIVDCYTIAQTFEEVGQYEFVVTVYYEGSCQVDARLTIKTQSIIITDVPNILAPDKDGQNLLFVKTNDPTLTILSMKVYDRWGNLIYINDQQYVAKGNESIGWNGKFGSNDVIPGVYVYIIETVSLLNSSVPKTEFLTGDVTIIR